MIGLEHPSSEWLECDLQIWGFVGSKKRECHWRKLNLKNVCMEILIGSKNRRFRYRLTHKKVLQFAETLILQII